MAERNGKWVTLDNGVHLFIEKGQTLDDAIKNNLETRRKANIEGTLKRNGIDVDNLDENQKDEKFKSVGGEGNWAYKAYADYSTDYIKQYDDYRNGLDEKELSIQAENDKSELSRKASLADIQAEKLKYDEDELTAAEIKEMRQKDPKRYDSNEYSQVEMLDHVEEDLGLDWHDVKQTYFLEDTFKENPKNAVVELKNGDYIEYNVETGERKDIKGEDWIDPWNRKTGEFKTEKQRKQDSFAERAKQYLRKKYKKEDKKK